LQFDQAVLGSLDQAGASSGVYSAAGTIGSAMPAGNQQDWATIVQSNPALADVAVKAGYDQSVVGSLVSVWA
jgi:hypothetical protein